MANNSAPGPDGITYSAWKATGEHGLNILWEALKAINHDPKATDHYNEFNHAILVCPPKKLPPLPRRHKHLP